jgi:glycosyltransferase involved in cell wall biosynthesis
MKLSVVTIVYNDIVHIENTIRSVLSQTYSDIEYIIIDGGSTDGTVEIIKKYSEQISFWSSERDNGLYDAMNKGLDRVTGDYVCFLNSGDLFYEPTTIAKIFGSTEEKDIDVFYGDTVIIDEQGRIKGKRRLPIPEKLTWKSFRNGMLVSHQAFIASMKIVPKYDLRYSLSSDFDWTIRILKRAKKTYNVHFTIIKFLDGGLTKKRLIRSLYERYKIMIKYYGFFTTQWIYIRNGVRFLVFVVRNRWF